MIANFEAVTYNVTELEIGIAEHLSKVFNKNHVGKDNSIKSSQIIKELRKKHRAWNIGDARLRKIINYIRHNNMCSCLLATSKGYYVSKSEGEVKRYLLSLEERAKEINRVRESLIGQYARKFKKKKIKL